MTADGCVSRAYRLIDRSSKVVSVTKCVDKTGLPTVQATAS